MLESPLTITMNTVSKLSPEATQLLRGYLLFLK